MYKANRSRDEDPRYTTAELVVFWLISTPDSIRLARMVRSNRSANPSTRRTSVPLSTTKQSRSFLLWTASGRTLSLEVETEDIINAEDSKIAAPAIGEARRLLDEK